MTAPDYLLKHKGNGSKLGTVLAHIGKAAFSHGARCFLTWGTFLASGVAPLGHVFFPLSV